MIIYVYRRSYFFYIYIFKGPLANLGQRPIWAHWRQAHLGLGPSWAPIWAHVPFGPVGPIGHRTHILTFREGPRIFLRSMHIQVYNYRSRILNSSNFNVAILIFKYAYLHIFNASFPNMVPYNQQIQLYPILGVWISPIFPYIANGCATGRNASHHHLR